MRGEPVIAEVLAEVRRGRRRPAAVAEAAPARRPARSAKSAPSREWTRFLVAFAAAGRRGLADARAHLQDHREAVAGRGAPAGKLARFERYLRQATVLQALIEHGISSSKGAINLRWRGKTHTGAVAGLLDGRVTLNLPVGEQVTIPLNEVPVEELVLASGALAGGAAEHRRAAVYGLMRGDVAAARAFLVKGEPWRAPTLVGDIDDLASAIRAHESGATPEAVAAAPADAAPATTPEAPAPPAADARPPLPGEIIEAPRPPLRPSPPDNLVVNGGFELRGEGGDVADLWKPHNWGVEALRYRVSSDIANPHGGARAVMVRAFEAGALPGVFTVLRKLSPGRYRLRFWACADVGARARVHAHLAGTEFPPVIAVEDWRQFVLDVDITRRKTYAQVKLYTSSANTKVWFDDVEVFAIGKGGGR
jgi:hypothetical protein